MAKEKKRGLAAEEKFIRTHDPDPHVRILTAGGPGNEQRFSPKGCRQSVCRLSNGCRLWRSVAQGIVSEQAKRDKRRFGGTLGLLNRFVTPTTRFLPGRPPGIQQENKL
ncbi:MAG TPA: hypothetical protein VG055_21885 [Planctomycetaceae bacterium]|jgi:hypothetical protein|nr:hypothetical protein [Planctomycetaceae bacterium]